VQAVSENAQNAAFEDERFLPLKQSELNKIKIEISVLSQLEEIHPKSSDELLKILKPNVHGLIIRKGWAGATFLPQVWEELPTHSQFLSNLCMKAGLPADEWKKPGMKFFIYTVEKFEE
jgi:AmmeMemoRadiSam system protein A